MTDAHIDNYADRIASGLANDRHPARLSRQDAEGIAERYGTTLPESDVETFTRREVSRAIAERLHRGG